jgi:tetratricopeptide (TPR) repeat protein
MAVPVVQPAAPSSTRLLNTALARLARDPRDMGALVDAGSAALELGDTDAAIGFFTRAEQMSPGNGGVRARIAVTMLRSSQPFEAIRWFDAADQAGFPAAEMAIERGLAYDLIGDNTAAQRHYQLALASGPRELGQSDEASRRYALSLVIGGDRRGAEQVIQPLLERRDRGAWRVRTFIMAIAGQSDEAEGIARATLPAELAASISPYLRYMPRLTAAQQAAAANLGRFPRAADIGRDDPQIVQYAALHPRAPRVDAGLVPTGAALGGKTRDDRSKRRRPGRDSKGDGNRETVLAAARPATAPPAVSAPWGLQPAAQPSKPVDIPAPITAPTPITAPIAAPRLAAAPVVLSRLDVPPGTPLPPAPAPRPQTQPQVQAQPVAQPVVQPIPVATPPPPAPAVRVAQSTPQAASPPVPVLALTLVPPAQSSPAQAAPVQAPAAQAPLLALAAPQPTPQPTLQPTLPPAPLPSAATALPNPAPGFALTPAPSAVQPAPPPPAAVAAAPGDFRSLFDGFKPPEQEAQPSTAAVDLARLEALRQAAPKSSRVKGKERGERPDGPVAVSRTSDDEPGPAFASTKLAKDTSKDTAKDRAKAATEKAAKDKAALDKACLELAARAKAGKGKAGKTSKTAAAKGKAGKGPVCKTETGKDKDKGAKNQPSHASRIWVQVLTGGNREAMGREWQGLVRDAAMLKGRKPYITPWRSNFRLLTGPFGSSAEAQGFVDKLRKDGVSGFEWTSPAGQAVDGLQVK